MLALVDEIYRTLKPVVIGVLIVAFCSASASVAAQENDSANSIGAAHLFTDDSLLKVTIEAPLTTLMRDRPKDGYLDGKFTFTADDGMEHTLDLKIRTRGKYRWKKTHCDFAPIRLNFRKKQVGDTEFDGQDKLKLVTHCQSKNSYYEQLLLREFLAYRFLNVMTDKSFGVRLLQINYVDTEGAKPMTKVGFIIEDDDDVAARNGMTSIKSGDLSGDDLEPVQQNLVNVFQYLIGNTEFSQFRSEPDEYCCHNIDLMSATKDAPYTPLAYDFDFSGIVNAPYAAPNPRFKHNDVRYRLYLGQCKNNELLPGTFQQFLDKKDAIYRIVDELEWLSSRSRKDVTRYLDGFYDHISKPKSVNTRFIEKCENSP